MFGVKYRKRSVFQNKHLDKELRAKLQIKTKMSDALYAKTIDREI